MNIWVKEELFQSLMRMLIRITRRIIQFQRFCSAFLKDPQKYNIELSKIAKWNHNKVFLIKFISNKPI